MSAGGVPAEGASLPNSLPRPPGEEEALHRAWAPPQGWRRFSAVNNTQIGAFYLGTALLFFVLAGVLALLIRAQLALPDSSLVSAGTYNQLFTMHGTVMMFLFAVPVVEAVAVYLLPGMLGARDLPFPRLSAYAFWTYAIGGLAFFCTIFFGASPDGGWFMYPPLTGKQYSPGIGADWWLLGIGFIEISAIAGAIEMIIGILFTRAPGMTLARMPVFAWAMLVTSLMVVFAFPAIIAGTLLLELERAFDWPFFIAARGGDPLLWQHLFWFFGHPEVYIIFLPAAGMVSVMVSTLAGTPLVGRRAVVAALVGVGAISFLLWIHHMATAGLSTRALQLASAASLAIAIPSAVQVFAWIGTLARGHVAFNAPTLFVLGFHAIFVIGGLTGVMVAVLPFDWQVHDSYFIVAHLHYVLIGGMVFPVFAALYYWAPVFNGTRLPERGGRWVFWLMFIGFNLCFFPMHIAGLLGMPRRVYTYAGDLGWTVWNQLSSLGALVFALGVALCLVQAWRGLRQPEKPHGNPWRAAGLEWLPAGEYGVRSIPQISSDEPLWTHPALADEVAAGRHWLPGTVFGGRETLVTSPRLARPWQLLRLPGDSWLPLLGAAGTAGFFLLMTPGWLLPAAACAVLAVGAIAAWLWQTDRPPPALLARIGDHQTVPTLAAPGRSHAWWATVILVAVEASIFAALAFAHLHTAMALDICPPPGAGLPTRATAAGVLALLLLSSVLLAWGGQGVVRAPWRVNTGLLLAMACAATALALDLGSHLQLGLAPARTAWSATVAALLGWQGLHVAVQVLMAGYLIARALGGRLVAGARASWDNSALLWHYINVQGAVGLLLIRGLAGG